MFQKFFNEFKRFQNKAFAQLRDMNRQINSSYDGMTKTLIGVNLGVWTAWNVCDPYFMRRHFMLSEYSTVHQHRYYTLLTYAFSHQSLLHLAFNCAGLWFFGRPAELALGATGMLKLYCAGALSGAAGIWWKYKFQSHRQIPLTLGASAATSAMFAFYVCQNPHAIVYFWFIPMPAYAVAGLLLMFGMMSGSEEIGGISHSGHMGGLIGGALFHFLSKGRY